MSIEEAASKIPCSPRTLWRYEKGKTVPMPDTVLRMTEAYHCCTLAEWYCSEICTIGRSLGRETRLKIKLKRRDAA
ncbi:MAG TPA: helix-turn-helix transcriptional regulator [Syntrophomonadaceae bacterium]|nr:helix-turn-helix transcriptional regulator [Syntrophomonadaceae bacterium]